MSSERPLKAYRFKELHEFAGVRRTQLRDMIRDGEFPAGVHLTDNSRTRIWFEDELLRWQAQRRASAKHVSAKRRRRA